MEQLTVYPRWRGEHEISTVDISVIGGLSPLARGTRDQHRQPKTTVRFIPAGAGNTVSEYAG
ncbi:hypothetical protein K801_12036 [Salmonella enterica subsp. enterica serovar Newport str. SHSN011]|nr:hypothetical protein K801_12036 [Salmonella enterica subsp. enterica serovar Newport str. SHSN011]